MRRRADDRIRRTDPRRRSAAVSRQRAARTADTARALRAKSCIITICSAAARRTTISRCGRRLRCARSSRRKASRVPVAVGMRNWKPYVADAMRTLADGGARRVLAFIMAAHRSEASFERYQATVDDARAELGEAAPEVVYPQPWHDHPLFVTAVASRAREALSRLDPPGAIARAIDLHRAQHSARDGAGGAVRRAANAVGAYCRGGSRNRHLAVRVSEPQRQSARRVARTRYQGHAAKPRRENRGASCRSVFCAITSRCCTISISRRRKSRAMRESGWSARRPSATIRCSSR